MNFRRNKRCINNCPVCGVFICPNYQNIDEDRLPDQFRNHKCDPEFIKRSERTRDAVMDRDTDDDAPRSRSFQQRLAEGFDMMREDETEDDD